MASTENDELDTGDLEILRSLETAMWQVETRGDRRWIDDHLAPGFAEFGRSGRRFSRNDVLELEVGDIDVELPLRDLAARLVGADAVLVTYRTIEGRGPSNRSSIWRRTDAGWLMEFHHGSPAG